MKRAWFLIFIAAALSLGAETSIWKISGGAGEFYLGGTIHILAETDYPLPAEYDWVYGRTDLLVLETDIGRMETPEMQGLLQSKIMLPEGVTLKQELKKTTLKKLEAYLQGIGLSLDPFMRLTPSMVALTVTVIEFQKLGMTAQGVDQFYYQRALDDGKGLDFFEPVENQVEFIATLGEGREDELILSTLSDIEKTGENKDFMLDAWRRGDKAALEELFIGPMAEEFPGMYRRLLVDRNTEWLEKIEELAQTPEKEFMLVGSAHLAGSDGLLERLEAAGYSVEQVVLPAGE